MGMPEWRSLAYSLTNNAEDGLPASMRTACSSSEGEPTLSEVRLLGSYQYICPPSQKDAGTYVPDATRPKRAWGLRRPSRNSYSPECVEGGSSEVVSKRLICPGMWNKRPQVAEQGGRQMGREPVVVQDCAREWETWPEEEVSRKGLVYWRTLISGDLTPS